MVKGHVHIAAAARFVVAFQANVHVSAIRAPDVHFQYSYVGRLLVSFCFPGVVAPLQSWIFTQIGNHIEGRRFLPPRSFVRQQAHPDGQRSWVFQCSPLANSDVSILRRVRPAFPVLNVATPLLSVLEERNQGPKLVLERCSIFCAIDSFSKQVHRVNQCILFNVGACCSRERPLALLRPELGGDVCLLRHVFEEPWCPSGPQVVKHPRVR